MKKHYIGVDNGVTGSVAVLSEDGQLVSYAAVPTKKVLGYTKKMKFLRKIDVVGLEKLIEGLPGAVVLLERPATNKNWSFNSLESSIRADEAVNIVVERLGYSLHYVDSREWQKEMLPVKTVPRAKKGASEEEKKKLRQARTRVKKQTKEASLNIGRRLFPGAEFKGDADSALMAEWARRKNL